MSIIHKDIAAIRVDYSKDKLDENRVRPDPIIQFQHWFAEALKAEVVEPNAMVLSTVSDDGFPSSRVVLLKDIKPTGFSFFTNYHSKKGTTMTSNKQVSLLFFWPELQRQVRVEGWAEKLPADDSDEYFASRPKASQIGALASPQSQEIPNRMVLETRVKELTQQFSDRDIVPRPAYWGGYLVTPLRVEFWQGRSNRLHDRIEYVFTNGRWSIHRLAP
ncbi:pyridoxamine 5'-phosphate oxidase [Sphingobacterium suaedae]|uniref:Pyridoxine/pyridoxamine 5'-phosphate oxidase n=1 Tax=Sphingobacterium suaedae TaxID=1686402 RepID=A0ABW5KIJ2_9SPHI